MSKPTIIFVEDDPTQAETFAQELESYCAAKHRQSPNIVMYPSEGAFLEAVERANSAADLYIFDLMLK